MKTTHRSFRTDPEVYIPGQLSLLLNSCLQDYVAIAFEELSMCHLQTYQVVLEVIFQIFTHHN